MLKKSLLALSVLAASGTTMAQSSVTLYGIADVFLGSVTSNNGTTSVTKTVLDSGNVSVSRWGMMGTEDLGGGLKANFNLENGFSMDTGAVANSGVLFGRQAWVGLSSGLGAVRLGRTNTAYYEVETNDVPIFNAYLSPEVQIFRSSHGLPDKFGASTKNNTYVSPSSNTLRYDSPSLSGFNAIASYSLDEKAPLDTTFNRDIPNGVSVAALALRYAGGPVIVSLGYQNEAKYNPPTNTSDRNFTRLQGQYSFGSFIARAGYGKAGNIANKTSADATEYVLGLDYKATDVLTLAAAYARSGDNAVESATVTGGTGDVSRTGYGLAAKYTLSKRTFLYGGYESDTQSKTGLNDAHHSLFALGMQHRF